MRSPRDLRQSQFSWGTFTLAGLSAIGEDGYLISRLTKWGLPLVAAACLIRLWLMPLGSSFWVDEMATVFVVEHGAEDPSLRVAPQVPQSIYYSVVRALDPGRSEIAYRLTSILFMALTLAFVALLAARLIHPNAWWFAVFACFSLKGIDYEAANARPYAMGLAVSAAGLYFLVRWLDTQSVRNAAMFVVSAALLWRVHLIFWPFYAVFAIYALIRRKDVQWWQIVIAFGLIGISLIPVAMRAVELSAQAKDHVVATQPTVLDLVRSLRLLLVAAAALGAWIWSRFSDPRTDRMVCGSTVALVLAWWLTQPLGLFAYSHLTGNSVFVPRYLVLSLPGTAASAALAAAFFLPARFWKPAALIMGIAALVVSADWKARWPHHHNSDWRAASAAINKLALPPSTPVICPSPFIEARPPAWTPDYRMPGFLYAHLLVYPVGGNSVLFPFADSPEAEDYAAALLNGAIPASGRFVVYGQSRFWNNWFEQRPELSGWSRRNLGPFDDVDVILFEKP